MTSSPPIWRTGWRCCRWTRPSRCISGIALPEEEHVSPAAKRFITYALDRLPELDVL